MELRLYFHMLRRGWWIILLTMLAALVVSLIISIMVTPLYEADARLILNPSSVLSLSGPNSVLNSLDTLDRDSLVATYAQVMNSNRVYLNALYNLQLQPQDMEGYSYEVAVIPNSYVIELRVSGPNPNLTASIANAMGYQTISVTQSLNQVIALDFLDMATPPDIPYRPQPLRDAALALVLGLVGGVVLAILSEQLRIPIDALRRQLQVDSMTGVYNRKYFSHLLEEELSQNPNESHSIGIVELTGIEDLLETLPIAGLQNILRKTSDVLRKELRGNDLIGRWNDNSFILLLPNTPAMAAQRRFERIFEMLSEPVKIEMLDVMVKLDIHIGGAEYSNNISANELSEKAEIALENAQRDTANPIYVWELESPFWTQPSEAEKE